MMFRPKVSLAISVLREIDKSPGITVKSISMRLNLSSSNIEDILTKLRTYVAGKRGPHGGYSMIDGVEYTHIRILDLYEKLGYSDKFIYTARAHALRCKELVTT